MKNSTTVVMLVIFGVVLGVLQQVQQGLSYLTTGQDVPDDIEVFDGGRLASLIVKQTGSAPAVPNGIGGGARRWEPGPLVASSPSIPVCRSDGAEASS